MKDEENNRILIFSVVLRDLFICYCFLLCFHHFLSSLLLYPPPSTSYSLIFYHTPLFFYPHPIPHPCSPLSHPHPLLFFFYHTSYPPCITLPSFLIFYHTPGLFLEGARWDFKETFLAESYPKILFSQAPTMLFKPYRKADVPEYPHYKCPVYKTSDRRYALSCTVLFCILSYFTTLYCCVLYSSLLYCTVFFYIVLWHSV